MSKDIYNFDQGRKSIVTDNLLKSYGIDQSKAIEKSEANNDDSLEKGGKRAVIGEKREFSGRMYIKTATGWKFFGKGTGTKAQDHHNSISTKQGGLKLDGTDNTDDVLAAHTRGEISSDHVRVHYSHQSAIANKKSQEATKNIDTSKPGTIKREVPSYTPDKIKHQQMKERQRGVDMDTKNAEKQKIKEKQAKTLASNKENLTRFLKEESWVRKRLEDNGFSDKNVLQQRLKQNFATFKDQANTILKKYGKDFDIDFNIDTDFRYNSFSIDVGFNFNQLHDKFEEYLTEQKQKFPHADKKTLLNPKLWGMLGEVLHVGENKYGGHSTFGSNLAFGLSSWSDDYNNSVRVK